MSRRPRVPPRAAEYVAPVQRLRIRYAKRGRLRFASHRDFQRALERALRRAEVPMAYSAGFSPHPRISYANAAPTGVASEAEYVEIGVTRVCDPDQVRAQLDAALPPGLDVVEVVEACTPDFAARLEASIWSIAFPGTDAAQVQEAVAALWARETAEVERMTKGGRRSIDVRGAILAVSLEADLDAGRGTATPQSGTLAVGVPCAILRVVVRQLTPSVRPEDVLAALRSVAGLVPGVPPMVTREAQGPLSAEGVLRVGDVHLGDPLAPDRENRADSVAPLPVPPHQT